METQKNSIKCCGWLGEKHKKALIIVGGFILLAIVTLSIAVAGWKMNERRNSVNGNINYDNYSGMMNRGNKIYPVPTPQDGTNQFVVPDDAIKSGEIAIIVNDLEAAKKAVSGIAVKGNGSVYATFISYVSGNSKNGSIVVQVPAENFDETFGALRGIGRQIIQESTQQISPRNTIYPMMAPASSTQKSANPDNTNDVPNINAPENKTAADATAVDKLSSTAIDAATIASPSIAIWPQPQVAQNKGYIKIIFVDYGKRESVGKFVGGINASQDGGRLWIVFGMKLLLLIVMFTILVIMMKRIFRNFLAIRRTKKTVHVVRQMPKTRARIVRIQKKK